ncbi:MAG: DsbA family protein [Candidatus Pacebacteria bacterium]|nr:DsbA family protein [Candidatus Paceibacterota bacterium]
MKTVKAAVQAENNEKTEKKASMKMISFTEVVNASIAHFGTALLIVAAFLIGMLWTEVRYLKKGVGTAPSYAPTAQAPTQQQNQPQETPLTDDQWKQVTSGAVFELGKKNAPVTMVEFTDYQCPFCARHFTETYGKLVENYVKSGKLRILVRDLPLSFHPNARPGAIAARCAGEQGKYEQMHDTLFGSQQDWSSLAGDAAKLKMNEYAKKIGLNTEKFDQCIKEEKYGKDVDADLALANKVGATGTPTFFVNKERIVGALPYIDFSARIDAMLKK